MSEEAVVKPGGASPKKAIITALIVVLFAILALLVFYYFNLIKPKVDVKQTAKTEGITWVTSIYGPSKEQSFKGLIDVAVDKNGNIYIPDSAVGRIYIFDSAGNFLRELQTPKEGKGTLVSPAGIDVDDEGLIYVSDRKLHKVFVYNQEGKFQKEWGVMYPHIPEVVGDKIFLTTYGPFYVYDKKGKLLAKWGKMGKEKGNFNRAYGVYIDNEYNVYIADMMNARVVARKRTGDFIWTLGAPKRFMTDYNTTFQAPTGIIGVEDGKLLYMTDGLDSSINVITIKGKLLGKMGELGSDDGLLNQPSAIDRISGNRFAIVDKGNKRVQILDIELTGEIKQAIEKLPAAEKPKAKSLLQKIREFLGI